MLKAVIFHHPALLTQDQQAQADFDCVLPWFKERGIRTAAFTTYAKNINGKLDDHGWPRVDIILTRSEVGANKGSPAWIHHICREFKVQPHELLYVGDDKYCWITALHAGTFFLHAKWVGGLEPGTTAITIERPLDVLMYVSHFLTMPPMWEYSLDVPEHDLCLRGLLGSGVTLPSTRPKSFTLQDVLTYNHSVQVDGWDAVDVLLLHALSNFYQEGLMSPNSYLTTYPGSKGAPNQTLGKFFRLAARLFKGYWKEDLLVRHRHAPDTSMERVRAKREGREYKTEIITQANTVHLNPKYADKLAGRPVLLFDDFSTTGTSLEWARNLLVSAGAGKLMMATVGKYPKPHTLYTPVGHDIIKPFEPKQYREDMFAQSYYRIQNTVGVQGVYRQLFQEWAEEKPHDF